MAGASISRRHGASPIPIEPTTPAPDGPRDPTTLADAAHRGPPGAVFLGVSDPRTSSFAAAGEDGAGTAVTVGTPWARCQPLEHDRGTRTGEDVGAHAAEHRQVEELMWEAIGWAETTSS